MQRTGASQEREVNVLGGEIELMGFTVHQTSEGNLFPQHSSHSSHSSHASHASSSIPGGSWGVPNLPNVPSAPYVPYPPYVPPVETPPAMLPPATSSPTTSPAPSEGQVDIAYIACTRALNGFGVNDIASELQGSYGVAGPDAVSIAKQALASVLGGGHYCDGYHGG
jgi:hypothetical protein